MASPCLTFLMLNSMSFSNKLHFKGKAALLTSSRARLKSNGGITLWSEPHSCTTSIKLVNHIFHGSHKGFAKSWRADGEHSNIHLVIVLFLVYTRPTQSGCEFK